MSEEKKIEELTEEELSKMTGGAWPEWVYEEFNQRVADGEDFTRLLQEYSRNYGNPWA